MRPVSEEKRELLIAAKLRGEKEDDIVRWLGVSKGTVGTLWRRHRKQGAAPPGKSPGRPPKLAPGDVERIGREVRRAPDATLDELIEGLSLPIGKSQLARLLAGLGLTLKKRRSIRGPSSAGTSSRKGTRGGRPPEA
jgi:transposase